MDLTPILSLLFGLIRGLIKPLLGLVMGSVLRLAVQEEGGFGHNHRIVHLLISHDRWWGEKGTRSCRIMVELYQGESLVSRYSVSSSLHRGKAEFPVSALAPDPVPIAIKLEGHADAYTVPFALVLGTEVSASEVVPIPNGSYRAVASAQDADGCSCRYEFQLTNEGSAPSGLTVKS